MRHAILILGHKTDNGSLQSLVNVLDGYDFDFYIHWDASEKELPIIKSRFSRIDILTNRVSAAWGTSSLIEAEMLLFRASFNIGYDYYHLISADDFLMMDKAHFISFFKKHEGYEFVGFDNNAPHESLMNRVQYYHPLMNVKINRKIRLLLIDATIYLQSKIIKYRKEVCLKLYKGSQWFSITNQAMKAILESDLNMFNNSVLVDEMFVQTILKSKSSDLKLKFYHSGDEMVNSARFIDWKRGNPHLFSKNELMEVFKNVNTNYVFGRKGEYELIDEINKMLLQSK